MSIAGDNLKRAQLQHRDPLAWAALAQPSEATGNGANFEMQVAHMLPSSIPRIEKLSFRNYRNFYGFCSMQCSRNRSSCKVCSLNAILHQTIYPNILYICILCIFWTHTYQYASTSCSGIKSFVLRPSFNPFPFLFRDRRLQVYTVFGSSLSQETEEYCTMVLESNCFRRYCYQSFSWASFTAKRGGTFGSMASSCKLRAKILISCCLWQYAIVSHSVSLGLMFFYAVTVVHRPTWEVIETKGTIWVVIHGKSIINI